MMADKERGRSAEEEVPPVLPGKWLALNALIVSSTLARVVDRETY